MPRRKRDEGQVIVMVKLLLPAMPPKRERGQQRSEQKQKNISGERFGERRM
jgi:hypothetical protein